MDGLLIHDSLLKGTEPSVKQTIMVMCCLPGARIKDVTERLTIIIKPTNNYPHNYAIMSLRTISRDYGQKSKTFGSTGNVFIFNGRSTPNKGMKESRNKPLAQEMVPRKELWILDHSLHYP